MKQHQELVPAALYARVSSDRQDVDLSISAQMRALRDYANKNNYLVVREYIDEAESGRVADRPQFRKMIEEGRQNNAPFREILVWKFSRFTRKREHAVAFKSMLRRRGIKVTSITEHADDTPTGKLLEAIIESVDEFYSENLAQEVRRGLRESASRGFWVSARPPYGYKRVHVQDGAKTRPRLEIVPGAASVVERIFDLAESGRSILDIARALNTEGVASPTGKQWSKTVVHKILNNEAYTGTLIWGVVAKDKAPPVRVENAFPAIVSKSQFKLISAYLRSRAPSVEHPRRVASTYLFSGLVKCKSCRRALTGQAAKSGKFAYYVCQSLIKRGKETCNAPRLNARRFERQVIDKLRYSVLSESNIRDLVKLVDEEMDGVAREQRKTLESINGKLKEVERWLDRLYRVIETTELDVTDIAPRIREHRGRQRKLQDAARAAKARLSERRLWLDNVETITTFAKDMREFLKDSELTARRAFIRSFVKEIWVVPGQARLRYTLPLPLDSEMPGMDAEVIALSPAVPSTVAANGAGGTRTPYLFNAIEALSQMSYSPTGL